MASLSYISIIYKLLPNVTLFLFSLMSSEFPETLNFLDFIYYIGSLALLHWIANAGEKH